MLKRRSIVKKVRNSSAPIAFAQNTREEVRNLCNVAGCVSAESGTHQTTYVVNQKRRNGNVKRTANTKTCHI